MSSIKKKNLRFYKRYKKPSFSFGQNWRNFLKLLTTEKIIIAKQSLTNFLGNMSNKKVLDIGSGSGLFSYSFYMLGVKKIVSFDIDKFSVECTKFLRSRVKNHDKWEIYHGSILDKGFISELGKFDIVYAWGVLHHTGKMWEAIKNTTTLINPNGLLYLAIYNKSKFSKYWLKIKEFYNLSPKIGKILLNLFFVSIIHFLYPVFKFTNPFKRVKNYQKNRGMDFFIDVKDWLGGYPYEYATFKEVIKTIERINPKLKLIKFKKVTSTGNNEFLFKKFDFD